MEFCTSNQPSHTMIKLCHTTVLYYKRICLLKQALNRPESTPKTIDIKFTGTQITKTITSKQDKTSLKMWMFQI